MTETKIGRRLTHRVYRLMAILANESGRTIENLDKNELQEYLKMSFDLINTYPTLILDKKTLTLMEKDLGND